MELQKGENKTIESKKQKLYRRKYTNEKKKTRSFAGAGDKLLSERNIRGFGKFHAWIFIGVSNDSLTNERTNERTDERDL